MQVMANDTIHLDDSQYSIDYVQAVYYSTGGQHFYTFTIANYDTDVPTLQVEMKAPDKNRIQGSQEVVIQDFTWLQLTDDSNAKITFSKALFWLKYTSKNTDGDPEYDILFVGDSSDGNVYKYQANIAVFAYDDDNGGDPLALEDVVDDTIVDPTIPTTPTALDETNVHIVPRKLFRDGQILIQRGDKTYTLQGQEVIVP